MVAFDIILGPSANMDYYEIMHERVLNRMTHNICVVPQGNVSKYFQFMASDQLKEKLTPELFFLFAR